MPAFKRSQENKGLPPLDTRERRKRKRELIAISLLSVLFIVLSIAEFRLTKVSTSLPFVNSIFFFGLLNINLVILIALVWLVARNVGKVFLERRRKILGSRLKTKLVIAFLAFSIIPTLVLFIISALYINSSFDKWFSIKIQNTLQASLEITRIFYRNTGQTTMHFAEHLGAAIGRRVAPGAEGGVPATRPVSPWMPAFLDAQRDLLALDAIEFYQDPLDERFISQRGQPGWALDPYPRLSLDLLDRVFGGEHLSVIQHIGSGDLIRCLVPVHSGAHAGAKVIGAIVVDSYIPVSLVNKVDEIASVFDDYKDTNPLKYPIKTAYFIILIMITLVIVFVAIWVGLYLARELTVPVERLVNGAKAVGAGDLDVSVTVTGHDEISVLIDSFNKMTRDLKDSRERLTEAGADLEKRRQQLEAVLANIGAGVIAVDTSRCITTFNRAMTEFLEIPQELAVGRPYQEVLQGEALPLRELIDRSFATPAPGSLPGIVAETAQWTHRSGAIAKALSAAATPLRESESNWGVVVVIDDMTHLIKGQREMAWREVARRIAHEIKNPLTPIKLSAQRLQRRLSDYYVGREGALIKECTDTIIRHTDELKEMVNEFSNFARFPEVSPAPHDLNAALTEVLTLFQQAHPQISFRVSLEGRLPIFEFDRDQIKRVIINLLDNAVAALVNLPVGKSRQIEVASHFNEGLRMAVIEVADNGPGMDDEVRTRVFEPYFSTKSEGTGLGLAIVKRIINDHDGFIRVHSTPGEGARFLIELPTSPRGGLDRKGSRLGT